MILLQLSSAQGPKECSLAVNKSLQVLLKEAKELSVEVGIEQEETLPQSDLLLSVLLSLSGENSSKLAQSWIGSIQWICHSPFRLNHKRKNWFIGVHNFTTEKFILDNEIQFEAMRASGPGGQHVNKTSSAIRATHIATGLSVKVQSERSQFANKRLAIMLLSFKLQEQQQQVKAQEKSALRLKHHQLERGNPTRTFIGIKFTQQ